MRQRVTIAIALACGPTILFADEPTTALDVTVQAQILDLLQEERQNRNMSMVLVTHDLGVVAGRTDEIAVMYAGKIVEKAPTRSLFANVRHPYTEALLKSIPKLENRSHTRLEVIAGRPPNLINTPPGCRFAPRCPYAQPRCREEEPPLAGVGDPRPRVRVLLSRRHARRRRGPRAQPCRAGRACGRRGRLGRHDRAGGGLTWPAAAPRTSDPTATRSSRVEDLVVEFPLGNTGLRVNAVSGISFDVLKGETLGLVGESGCGKSTTGRAIMQLPRPTGGQVRFDGAELTGLDPEDVRRVRPQMQMIFQDPISSLNPRRKVKDIVAEPLAIWKVGSDEEREQRVRTVLEDVGIDPEIAAGRKPHQFSGGQCQRICVARALVLDPKLIICDEPVSALDVSVQAQILNLLEDMKARYGLTMIFIAHDLAVVKNISDRVCVMYLGKICEVAPPDELYRAPAHPYTELLLEVDPGPRSDGDPRHARPDQG